jgi:pSer/pThr/pTyr-binding forkhead associated (FHA) protein
MLGLVFFFQICFDHRIQTHHPYNYFLIGQVLICRNKFFKKMSKYQLIVCRNDQVSNNIDINHLLKFGTSDNCDIKFNLKNGKKKQIKKGLAEYHSALIIDEEKNEYYIKNIDGGGTMVNDELIEEEKVKLNVGDVIRFPSTKFLFKFEKKIKKPKKKTVEEKEKEEIEREELSLEFEKEEEEEENEKKRKYDQISKKDQKETTKNKSYDKNSNNTMELQIKFLKEELEFTLEDQKNKIKEKDDLINYLNGQIEQKDVKINN